MGNIIFLFRLTCRYMVIAIGKKLPCPQSFAFVWSWACSCTAEANGACSVHRRLEIPAWVAEALTDGCCARYLLLARRGLHSRQRAESTSPRSTGCGVHLGRPGWPAAGDGATWSTSPTAPWRNWRCSSAPCRHLCTLLLWQAYCNWLRRLWAAG